MLEFVSYSRKQVGTLVFSFFLFIYRLSHMVTYPSHHDTLWWVLGKHESIRLCFLCFPSNKRGIMLHLQSKQVDTVGTHLFEL